MKKYIIPVLIAILLTALVAWIYFQNTPLKLGNRNDSSDDYQASKVSTENDLSQNTTSPQTNTTDGSEENSSTPSQEIPPAITEQDIATFSTKVTGTSARKNNISICTSLLNDTVIEPEKTFSFWETVGNTTAEKGYQKAKSFNEHGKTIQTYGGGVCQVSTTLYNAVLSAPELKVTERHPHSKRVTYVPKDKDASVAYSSSDFKFQNNSTSSVKIYANYEKKTLAIRLVKLSNS